MAVKRRSRTKEPPHHEVTLDELVSKAVVMTLTNIGFDMRDPIAIQEDIAHLRKSRQWCEFLFKKSVAVGISLLVTATAGAAWLGFGMKLSALLHGQPTP